MSSISSTNDEERVSNTEATPVETEINVTQDENKIGRKKKSKNKIKENNVEQFVQKPQESEHNTTTTDMANKSKTRKNNIVQSETSRNEGNKIKFASANMPKRIKKKKDKNQFTVENADNVMPSKINDQNIENRFNKNKKLKRKLENTAETQVPNKKKKKNKLFNKQTKYQKSSNIQNEKSDPLSKLSDERLKAYGLNPKKYRSFLKYKKF